MSTKEYTPALQAALQRLQKQLIAYTQVAYSEKNYPPSLEKVQQALHLLTLLLEVKSIDDEALYAFWKTYQKERTLWVTITLPAYKAAIVDLLPVVKSTKQHLRIIIAAAKDYLNNYEEHHPKIVGETMQRRFQQFQEQVTEELHAPKVAGSTFRSS